MEMSLLKSILECPICLQIPSGKVYMCQNSHKLCARCFYKLRDDLCPQGKCDFRFPEPFRSREMEDLIEKCGFDLTCGFDGCNVVLQAVEMRAHEEECPRRLVSCFLDEDCERLAMADMPDHLIEIHGSKFYGERNILEGGEGSFFSKETLDDMDDDLDMNGGTDQFTFDGHRFFYTFAVSDGIWFVWAAVNAGQRVADRYTATLSLKQRDSPFQVETTVRVLSVDVPREKVFQSGQCMVTNTAQVKALMSECRDEKKRKEGYDHVLLDAVEIRKIES